MASGKTHNKVNYVSFILLMILLVYLGFQSLLLGFFMGLGVFFGTNYFGPDLDIRSSLYYRWGRLRWIWLPYQKMFKHRSIFTHGFIIGDIVRIIYFILVLVILLIPISLLTSSLITPLTFKGIIVYIATNFKYEALFFILGILFSSIIHTITDYATTAYKKMKYS